MELTKCRLVCDTREKNVTRHADAFAGVRTERLQMTTSDYAIKTPTDKILVVIERKSLDDYGASLKDGRHDNKNKLIAMRELTGCRIVYLIEGPAFPDPNDTFSRIAYKNIESSIFHLMIADGITVMRTKDTYDTARTLARFVRSMDTLYERIGDTILGGDARNDGGDNITPGDANTTANGLLTSKQSASEATIVRSLWSCFRGITVETASEYMRKWSIADIVRGRVSYNDIANFRTANGRAISAPAIRALTSIDKVMEIRLLGEIPGVSKHVATNLLEKTSLSALLSYGGEMAIEIVHRDKSGKAKRRLGPALAAAITRHFNYKLGVDELTDGKSVDMPVGVSLDASKPKKAKGRTIGVIPGSMTPETPETPKVIIPTVIIPNNIYMPMVALLPTPECLASIDDFLSGLG